MGAQRRSGFSMVELLMVIMVMAVLAVVAAPSYIASLGHHRTLAASKKIIADLKLAQRHAKLKGADQSVTFSVSADQYSFTGLKSRDHVTADYSVDLMSSPYHVDVVSASFGDDTTLVYDGYGMPDSGGTIVIGSGAKQLTLSVDPNTGTASVQ